MYIQQHKIRILCMFMVNEWINGWMDTSAGIHIIYAL